ncbi:MAG: hypothetical protein AAB462_01225 [Patescibacteria group bacterium]
MSISPQSPEKSKFIYSPAGITINIFGVYRTISDKLPELGKRGQVKEIGKLASGLQQGRFKQPYNGYTDIDVKDEAVTVTSGNFDRKTKEPFTLETRVSMGADGKIVAIDQVNARQVLDGNLPGVSVKDASYNVVDGEGSLNLRDAIAELRRAQHTMNGTTPFPTAIRVH